LVDRVEAAFGPGHPPCAQDVTEAFWAACHGGQRATAELLLARGADPDWVGYDGLTPLEAARRSGADDVVAWLAGR
jgi:ankyrin repeat protein